MYSKECQGEALGLLRALPTPSRLQSDDELLACAEGWEELGRFVDARRAAAAAEVQWRSRDGLGADGLAARLEVKNGTELLAARLRISTLEAQRRIRLGTPLAPRYSLTMEEGPARFPLLAGAVHTGQVGLESARIIATMLHAARRRATPEDVTTAEAALTEAALTVSPELVAVHAQVWALRVDPDGARPQEHLQHRARSFRLGRIRPDGLTPLTALLLVEDRAVLEGALNDHRKGINWLLGAEPDGDEDLHLDWHEASGDERTKAQFQYDTFVSILKAGIRAEQDGTGDSLATPHEVITVVTAEALQARQGAGHPDGILARYSIPTVERLQCGGRSRLLVTGPDGEALHLGRATRLFTRAQRRALAARDGGCAWPGCTAPITWSEAHHIRWYTRDHGTTDIDNGVLLCSHHHHRIHTTKQWEIQVHQHLPYLVPKGWQGPPLAQHRMQQHPMRVAVPPPART